MFIVGIDPGTIRMGYGVVKREGDKVALVECGALSPPKRSSIGERLLFLYQELLKIIKRHQPEAVAVESPFVSENVHTALAIGRAQAIALLAAAACGVPAYEYSPAHIKQAVTSYGASTKEQVQEMVKLHLNLDAVPEPHDASDALATAICHVHETHMERLAAEQEEKK